MSIPFLQHVVEQCQRENPRAWEHAHTKGDPETGDFIRKLVPMLRAIDPNFGWNGKRGDPNNISDDAVNYICTAEESEGRTPDGRPCVVIDVIASAGAKPPYTAENRPPKASWGIYNTKIEGSGANVIAMPALPGTPNAPAPSAPLELPSYGMMGDDAFFVDKVGAFVAEEMGAPKCRNCGSHDIEGGMNAGSASWIARTVHSMMAAFVKHRDNRDADTITRKHRNEMRGVLNRPPL